MDESHWCNSLILHGWEDTEVVRLVVVGFNPYNRIRRNRTTRWGDVLYVGAFLVVLAALVVWATL